MKTILRYGFLLMILTTGNMNSGIAAEGAPEQVAAALGNRAMTNSSAMDILTSLTTEIGPRLAGSDAERRAADWAKRQFEKLGFDTVSVESFPIGNGWMRGVEKAEVTSPSPQTLAVTALGWSVPTPPEGIEAEIALFKTFADMLAAPEGSLAGKIAVMTQPMGRGEYGTLARFRSTGASEAARRGAVAFLLRSLGTDNNRLPHTGIMTYAPGQPRIPAGALSVPDALQLDRLIALGKPVRIKLVLTPRELGSATSQNIIADLKGREKSDEIVLLGAHLDSWDLGTGAVDDGAGVAIVMAAAKLVRELPQRPKRTIRVVLYGAEEIGLVGGKAYAEAHKAELPNHIIVAEPDLGQGPVVRFQTGVANPDDASIKAMRAALASLGVVPGDNQSRGSSDVEPLVALGVPAATLDLESAEYFDLHHTANDTLDKVRPEKLNQSTAAYAVFLYLAAEMGANYRAPAK